MDLSNLDSFRKQIASAQTSIQSLYGLRNIIDGRISDLKDLVRANANFLPDEERESELLALEMLRIPENITEAVKITLFLARGRKQSLTPIQIKEQAEERGFNFSGYTNPMASVHTILKRMKEADPPQVSFNEQTGEYTYVKGTPFEISDKSVFERLNSLAWYKVVRSDREHADEIAREVLKGFLESMDHKVKRQKALKEAEDSA